MTVKFKKGSKVEINSLQPQQEDEKKQINFEDVIVKSIGEFGRWQILILIACKVPMFVGAWGMIMMGYAGADPDWWIEETTVNTTTNLTTIRRFFKTCPTNVNQTVVFQKDMYTIVSEWSLICSKDWIPNALSTCQMVGVLIGAAVGGQLAESIGRKKAVLLQFGTVTIVMFIESLSVNWQMMMACVFFIGFSLGGFLVVISCFTLEFISVKWRTFASVFPAWGVGVMAFGILFKFLPNWRHLCVATGLLGIPIFILILFIPESIRWLFTHGHFDEGKKILRRLARQNGMPEPDLSLLDQAMKHQEENAKNQKNYTYLSLFKFRSTRRIIPIFAYMWFFAAFGYYALTLGVGKLSGDITLNMILMGLGEMTCMFIVWLVSKCLGRKYTTMVLWSGVGLSSFVITLTYFTSTEENFKTFVNIFALMSRFFLSAAWASLILFTVESFPTSIRAVAYGFVSVCGRIGGIAGTQNDSFSKIVVHLPFTINGVLAMICAFLCIFLKDTYSAPMEDFIEDEENTKRKSDVELNIQGSENTALTHDT